VREPENKTWVELLDVPVGIASANDIGNNVNGKNGKWLPDFIERLKASA